MSIVVILVAKVIGKYYVEYYRLRLLSDSFFFLISTLFYFTSLKTCPRDETVSHKEMQQINTRS